jgi:3-oxosteroid 1-dehydrogenase
MSGSTQWDHETDILVVGSGGGALTAAVAASECGGQVIVVEKAEAYGGTSATSGGGIWIPCNHHQAEHGVSDDPEDAFRYLKALIGDDVPDEKIRAYLTNAPKMLEWMEANSELKYRAVGYSDYHPELAGSRLGHRTLEPVPYDLNNLGDGVAEMRQPHPGTRPIGQINWTMNESRGLVTRRPGWLKILATIMLRYYLDIPQRLKTNMDRRLTLGNALIARLKVSLDKRNVPIWLNTKLLELVRENGRIAGAIVEREGKRLAIGARRGVILGAGGFERSPTMRRANLKNPTDPEWSGSQPYNTGDAITAGIEIGAATALMDAAWWAPVIRLDDEDRARPLFYERSLPGTIIVNQAGQRYMNEAASYHTTGKGMQDANRPEASTVPSFILFDGTYRRKYPMGPLLPGSPSGDAKLKPNVTAALFKSDSWAGLAEQIKVPAAALEATIQRFNAMAKAGKDEDFRRGENAYDQYYGDPRIKPNGNLGALETAPFYAFTIYPGDIGTKGGLQTDVNGQVVDTEDRPIAGLYATGNTSASVLGRSYPGAGGTIGPAMCFGFLAARHAMGRND